MINVTPVILCGGPGTRLWSVSHAGFPKQFLCLTGKESLFQKAALRLSNLGKTGIQVAVPLIAKGGSFNVKRIQVKPKANLSLQNHHHRAEHSIVLSSTAEFINGDKGSDPHGEPINLYPLGRSLPACQFRHHPIENHRSTDR